MWGASSPGTPQLVSSRLRRPRAHTRIPCSLRLPPTHPGEKRQNSQLSGTICSRRGTRLGLQLQILLLHLVPGTVRLRGGPVGPWPSAPPTGAVFPGQGATGPGQGQAVRGNQGAGLAKPRRTRGETDQAEETTESTGVQRCVREIYKSPGFLQLPAYLFL